MSEAGALVAAHSVNPLANLAVSSPLVTCTDQACELHQEAVLWARTNIRSMVSVGTSSGRNPRQLYLLFRSFSSVTSSVMNFVPSVYRVISQWPELIRPAYRDRTRCGRLRRHGRADMSR